MKEECWCTPPSTDTTKEKPGGGLVKRGSLPSCHRKRFLSSTPESTLSPWPSPLPWVWFWQPASGRGIGWGRAGLEIGQAVGMWPPPLPRDSMLPFRG